MDYFHSPVCRDLLALLKSNPILHAEVFIMTKRERVEKIRQSCSKWIWAYPFDYLCADCRAKIAKIEEPNRIVKFIKRTAIAIARGKG